MADPPIYEKIGHLWSGPYAEVVLTRAEVRAAMLQTGGSIIRAGRLYDLKATHLGGGIYRVTTALRVSEHAADA